MAKRVQEIPTFINKEIVRITGLKAKTIDFYTKTGIVLPSIFAGKGKGTARIYNAQDVLKFMLIPVLSDHGLTLEKIGKVFDHVKRDLFNVSSPHLYHGLPHSRAIICVYDIGTDKLKANVFFPPDPEACGENKEHYRKHLESLAVDLVNHGSVLMVDITETIRKMQEVENIIDGWDGSKKEE